MLDKSSLLKSQGSLYLEYTEYTLQNFWFYSIPKDGYSTNILQV